MSVNVPPTSTPTLIIFAPSPSSSGALQRVQRQKHSLFPAGPPAGIE
jgi:hypothetical protein